MTRSSRTMPFSLAIEDENLLAPFYRGESWNTWKVVHRVLDGLPLDADQRRVYRLSTGRKTPPKTPPREFGLVKRRRDGGSANWGRRAAWDTATFDPRRLAPGERGVYVLGAPDRSQSKVLLGYARETLVQVPLLARMIESETADEIRLTNRTSIRVTTANFRTIRGLSCIGAALDEVAFLRSEESAQPDIELLAALRPAMAMIPTAQLILSSTPYRRAGELYRIFTCHFGTDSRRVVAWSGAAVPLNPLLDPEVIREAFEADPDRAASEFACEWRTDLETFLSRDLIASATVPGRMALPPIRGTRYVGFVDVASGSGADSTTGAIAHNEDGLLVLDRLYERRPPFKPQSAIEELCGMFAEFGLRDVHGDRYAPGFVTEAFGKCGVRYHPAKLTRSEVYLEVLPHFAAGRVELLDIPRLATQLASLHRRARPGGREEVNHPAAGGSHDDAANAACGAFAMANKGRQPGDYGITI